MERFEVPENQLTIFDMLQNPEEPKVELFSEDKAIWHQKEHWKQYMPNEWLCVVTGIIPLSVRSPTDKNRKGVSFSEEWLKQQETWGEYTHSIAELIPYHERGERDANGWSAACEMLEEYRDRQKPIKLAIWKRHTNLFRNLEVVEYLEAKKSEDELDASNT